MYILSGTEAKGGATKSFLAMADSVAAAGYDVAVVVPDGDGITTTLKLRGWTVLAVPYMFATLPYLSLSSRELLRFFPRLVRAKILNRRARKIVNAFAEKWKPDIIHDNTSVTDLGYYAARKLNVPHVVHIREYGWRDFRRLDPGLKKRLTASDTYLAAITSDLASFRGKGIDSSRVRVIYNGIVSEHPGLYLPHKMPYFLYAGRIREAKGVGDLIEAYVAYGSAELSKGNQPLRLKMAGGFEPGEFLNRIKEKIHEAGLDEYVEWLGEIDDVYRLYSLTVATVIPSRAEGFGRVMPEAMSAGSLCVARDEGGLAEQLDNGRNVCGREIALGYDTVDELAAILADLGKTYADGREFEEGGRYFRMIADSREVVGRLYSYEANARGILEYYADIINKSKYR